MTNESQTRVLITGVSRAEGIGFALARHLCQQGMAVLITARAADKAAGLAERARAEGFDVESHALDVTAKASVEALRSHVESTHGRLDALVNNAGTNFDFMTRTVDGDPELALRTLDANVMGAWRMAHAFLPLLRKSPHPRIVNVSSEAGSFAAPNGMPTRGETLAAYCVSKAALNALTVKLAAALSGTGVLVNAVCPGFVATYPGTEAMGARPPAEGAASVAWAVTLPDGGPSGGFFRDGHALPW